MPNSIKHTTTIDPNREETCKQAFADICAVLMKYQIRTNEIIELVNDLIINVALQISDGNQIKAGELLRDYYLPDMQATIAELLENEIEERDVTAIAHLSAFDVTGKTPN